MTIQHLSRISATDAHDEIEADRIFVEPGAYPKIIISTTIDVEGFTLNVTLHDTSISDAVALLRRQGRAARPATQPLIQPPRKARRTRAKPAYDAVWLDLDDALPSPAAEQIVQQATALLQSSAVPFWSNAIEQARKHLK